MVDRRSFPSLRAFATFQAAARHLSFTRAASELNISQAAVSQQIRFLETSLRCPLFERQRNALLLTRDGALLLEAVDQGLGTIGTAVTFLRGDAGKDASVTISATTAMAQEFLGPLARRYRSENPDAKLVVFASDEDNALHAFEDVDLAFVCGIERFRAGDDLQFLFNEMVQPMCSPDYLARYGPFETVESIARSDLLDLHEKHWQSAGIGWQPLDWDTWFSENGGYRVSPNTFSTNSYSLLNAAALAGEGMMLGWKHLTKFHVETGAIVEASPRITVRERGNFLKINRKRTASKPHARAFADTVLQEAYALRGDLSC